MICKIRSIFSYRRSRENGRYRIHPLRVKWCT